MKGLPLIIIVFLCINSISYAQKNTIHLTESSITPTIDGIIQESEWKDAKEILINVIANQNVTVLVKYDAKNLFVAFINLTNANKIRLNPELLIHTEVENLGWNENCYWFHSSYGNCAAIGQYYYWEDCTTNPIGWKANTFPFKNENNNMEFKISFSKLNITPTKGKQLKIAFKLSDPLEQHAYWPETATIANPLSWGLIKL